MYSVYIHCKEKIGQGGGGCRKTVSPFLSLPGAGSDLSLAWAPGTERRDTLPQNDRPGQ